MGSFIVREILTMFFFFLLFSTNNTPDDDSLNRYPHTDRTTCGRYSRDPNSVNSVQGNSLEKKIEELERVTGLLNCMFFFFFIRNKIINI